MKAHNRVIVGFRVLKRLGTALLMKAHNLVIIGSRVLRWAC